MNKKYILIIIILAFLFVAGALVCREMDVLDNADIPIFILDKSDEETKEERVSPLDCDKEYIVTCFEPGEKIMTIKCSVNEDCLLANMEAYCSPGRPDLFACDKEKEHYCGERGFCRGCVCAH